jgi:hypothetical protein
VVAAAAFRPGPIPRPVRGVAVGRGAGRAGRIDAAGMIAISGVTRTDKAGTTSSSVRFSPLNTSPS